MAGADDVSRALIRATDDASRRRVARRFASLPAAEVDTLLWSEHRDDRLTALLILVEQYRAGGDTAAIVEQVLDAARAERVDDEELVAVVAEPILGDAHREGSRNAFFQLAKSDIVWVRMLALLATGVFVKAGDPSTTLELAERLARERHPGMRHVSGTMLRTIGKRMPGALIPFLERTARRLPRDVVHTAVEHLPAEQAERITALAKG